MTTPASLNAPTSTAAAAEAHAATTDVPAIYPAIVGWQAYPEGSGSYNPFNCDATEARHRLNEQANLIFSDRDISVDIIDATGKSNPPCRSSV